MQPEEAMQRCNAVMAHAWMVRNFLKHAEEVEDDEGMQEVHRTIFDFIRAVEPSYQRGDVKDYLRRLKGKLPKLRQAAEHLSGHYAEFSTHTNFHMAAASLAACVRHFTEILDAVPKPGAGPREADPEG